MTPVMKQLSIIVYLLLTWVFVPGASAGECEHPVSVEGDMVWIESGEFVMGNNHGHRDPTTGNQQPFPEERFEHKVQVEGFWIDRFEVTNEAFTRFVEKTGYVTVAERDPLKEWFPLDTPAELMVPASAVFVMSDDGQFNGWQLVPGANWRQPEGPGSTISDRMEHPVVHVAREDAEAYARWVGRELPTEAQWEYAARGGLVRAPYTWGDQFKPGGKYMANTWQGQFPREHRVEDGFAGTAPVGCFPANGFGLYDMAGNVWEIVSDNFLPQHTAVDGASVSDGDSHVTLTNVIKGGSFLCTPTFCMRYRPAARQSQEHTFSTSHIGFRTVKNSP